jgi:hypothetical protein
MCEGSQARSLAQVGLARFARLKDAPPSSIKAAFLGSAAARKINHESIRQSRVKMAL